MSRHLRAIVLAFALVVAGGILLWWWATPPSALLGAHLRVRANEGAAEPDPTGGPVVPVYGADTPVELDVSLCPGGAIALPSEPEASLWAAPGRGEWHVVVPQIPWEDRGDGCLRAELVQAADVLWPGVDGGVVRWAVLVGDGSERPPTTDNAGVEWRDRGLLVVDGEAIRAR